MGQKAIRISKRRLACSYNEIVDANGICRHPPKGLSAQKYNKKRDAEDRIITQEILFRMNALIDVQDDCMRNVKKYAPRATTRKEGETIMKHVKNLDKIMQTYVNELLRCSDNNEFLSTEELLYCLRRKEYRKHILKYENEIESTVQKLNKSFWKAS